MCFRNTFLIREAKWIDKKLTKEMNSGSIHASHRQTPIVDNTAKKAFRCQRGDILEEDGMKSALDLWEDSLNRFHVPRQVSDGYLGHHT